MSLTSQQILKMTPVVPVITIQNEEDAVPLAQALVKGGIPVLEVTLRTPFGLSAISRIKQEVPNAVVGAGTITSLAELEKAVAAGSQFIITPGLTDRLLDAGVATGLPFMPGIATVSEMMNCLEKGLDTLKFFPAEANGGAKALKAFGGPFSGVSFCPTGGIGPGNIAEYLALPSVLSVGGSWIVPDAMVAEGNWKGITQLAREACDLVSTIRQASK